MYIADLHIHSNKSDGILSPEEIIDWGVRKGLKALSITDHDNIDAVVNASRFADNQGIEFVPGIEITTDYEGTEVHILGYYYDYTDQSLKSFLDKLKYYRIERAKAIIEKLNINGIDITYEDVYNIARDASSIGRPHIARAIVNSGNLLSVEEAFEKYLSYGKPAYVERYKVSPFKAIEIISACKGVTSLAHPGLLSNIDKLWLIKKLKEWGLDGIEVYHTKHTFRDIKHFYEITKTLKLLQTGGTDCHGNIINGQPILGSIGVEYENLLLLKERSNSK